MPRWIDLSRPIVEGMSVYPGDPIFQVAPFADYETDGFRGVKFSFGSHLGTHVDAPAHYFCDGEPLDAFPLDRFIGKGITLDLTSLVGADSARFELREPGRPATITVEDLEPYEKLVASVPFLFLRTGWSRRFGASDYYTDFPSLSPETCDWLCDFADLRMLGLETPSLASFPVACDADDADALGKAFDEEFAELLPNNILETPTFTEEEMESAPLDEVELHADAECHRILLGRRPPILILEGLIDLEQTPAYEVTPDRVDAIEARPEYEFDVVCMPLPIVGVDGCPVRVGVKVEA